VDLLLAIADDVSAAPRERIAATRVLLEYGFSKPAPELEDQAAALTETISVIWGNGKPADPAMPPKVYDV